MPEINKKRLKMNKKVVFVYSSKLVYMKKLVDSMRAYLKFVFFSVNISVDVLILWSLSTALDVYHIPRAVSLVTLENLEL